MDEPAGEAGWPDNGAADYRAANQVSTVSTKDRRNMGRSKGDGRGVRRYRMGYNASCTAKILDASSAAAAKRMGNLDSAVREENMGPVLAISTFSYYFR